MDAAEAVPSAKVTLMTDPPWTTWRAVRMSPWVLMMIPVPRSLVSAVPAACDSITTSPARAAANTWDATGGWDCSAEIAVSTFRFTIPLTSLAPSVGRRDNRLVTRTAAKTTTTTAASTSQPDRHPPLRNRPSRSQPGRPSPWPQSPGFHRPRGPSGGPGGVQSSGSGMGASSSVGAPPSLMAPTVLARPSSRTSRPRPVSGGPIASLP